MTRGMTATQKPAPLPLRVCAFTGSQNLPLYVARQLGFFAELGLDVELVYTAGSTAQLVGLARGEYDLVQTAPDNVINLDNDPAAFGLDPTTAPHVTMLLGGSVGPLSLYAQPAVTGFGDLRGAVLGVDNPFSGFALVLRDMLARNGLLLNRDYVVTVAGGTSARLEALTRGSVAATILYAPFDAAAEQAGFQRLATSTEYYGAYASLATAGTATWIETHGDGVIHYIAAILRSLRWIYDPIHAFEAQSILRAEDILGLDAAQAAHAYAAFVAPAIGFDVEARLDTAGLQQVIALRATYGNPPRPLGEPADYQDLRWYEQARSFYGPSARP
jgi:ABC-type nitrate/sulfonate/bicarbonate transport system substrate-binding protein